MFLVDRQTVPAALRDESSTRLKLRVRGDGQVIELAVGKTTIGSSPRCNLRLDRPGVEPLHCLVVDGPEGPRVRRWAADTRLNGEPVEDAPLEAGDCLSLGGVELELVGPAPAVESGESVVESVAESFLPGREADGDAHEPLWEGSLALVPYAIPQQDVFDREIGVGDACYPEDFAVLSSGVVSDDVASEVEEQRGAKDILPEFDAAELVFRQLQAACGMARGRNRKMLAALRTLRAEKNALVRRLESGERSDESSQERASWENARQKAEQEQRDLHLELKELRRQLGEWEARLAEHSQQMADLQQELFAARASRQRLVGNQSCLNAVDSIELPEQRAEAAISQPARELETVRSETLEALPLDPTVYGAAEEVAPEMFGDARSEERHANGLSQADVLEVAHAVKDFGAEAADPWDSPSERNVDWTLPAVPSDEVSIAARPWDDATRGDSYGASSFDDKNGIEAPRLERAAREIDEVRVSDVAEEDLSPFAEFSIWKQGARSEQSSFERAATSAEEEPAVDEAPAWGGGSFVGLADSSAAELEKAIEYSVTAEEANPWAVNERVGAADLSQESAPEIESPTGPVQPTSFIERYSHLFGDEQASAPAEKVELPVVQSMQATPLLAAERNASAPIATSSDDEESIEQYMAKLMKRVRGDNPVVAASQAGPPSAPLVVEGPAAAPGTSNPEPVDQKAAAAPSPEPAHSEVEQPEVAVNWDAFVRRAATAPATNLGALRALANETARRDISRHQLKKHRRDAVTKVIVSTLAGMTSLWLMLDAENWRNIQFITACISLLVAAYWAGEAFREMIRSMRDAYEGPRSDEAESAALPIDVDG